MSRKGWTLLKWTLRILHQLLHSSHSTLRATITVLAAPAGLPPTCLQKGEQYQKNYLLCAACLSKTGLLLHYGPSFPPPSNVFFLIKIPTSEHKFSLLLTLLFLLLSLQAPRENESKADKKGCPLNRQYSLINIHFHPRSTFEWNTDSVKGTGLRWDFFFSFFFFKYKVLNFNILEISFGIPEVSGFNILIINSLTVSSQLFKHKLIQPLLWSFFY